MATKTKICHVSLTVEILVRIKIDADCPDDALEMIARESVSLASTGQEDVSLEVENIKAVDIVEVMRFMSPQETNNVR